jgi:hypothetical protein
MIVDNLLLILPRYDIDPFKRIYNVIVDRATEYKEEYKLISQPMSTRSREFYDKLKKHFGFTTTGGSRNTLYSTVLQNAAKNAGHLVRDKTLSMEIRGLVVKNGRIDHDASGHDDMVIAWLLCHWFVTLSKNLHHYGIDPTKILTAVSNKNRQLSEIEIIERENINQIKAEIDDLFEDLVNETNNVVILKLENRIRTLIERLPEEESEALSLESLIQKANEERLSKGMRVSRHKDQGLRKINMW